MGVIALGLHPEPARATTTSSTPNIFLTTLELTAGSIGDSQWIAASIKVDVEVPLQLVRSTSAAIVTEAGPSVGDKCSSTTGTTRAGETLHAAVVGTGRRTEGRVDKIPQRIDDASIDGAELIVGPAGGVECFDGALGDGGRGCLSRGRGCGRCSGDGGSDGQSDGYGSVSRYHSRRRSRHNRAGGCARHWNSRGRRSRPRRDGSSACGGGIDTIAAGDCCWIHGRSTCATSFFADDGARPVVVFVIFLIFLRRLRAPPWTKRAFLPGCTGIGRIETGRGLYCGCSRANDGCSNGRDDGRDNSIRRGDCNEGGVCYRICVCGLGKGSGRSLHGCGCYSCRLRRRSNRVDRCGRGLLHHPVRLSTGNCSSADG